MLVRPTRPSVLLVLAVVSSAVAPAYTVLVPATVATTWVGPPFRAAVFLSSHHSCSEFLQT
jgi:hypothetical protein